MFTGERSDVLRKRAVDRNWARARAAVADLPAASTSTISDTRPTRSPPTGASTAELMHRMGHASSAAALRYQHATEERDIEVARRLDEFVAQRTRPSERFRAMDARWVSQSPPARTRPGRQQPLTRTFLVETMGLEPTTPCLQSRCSSQLSYVPVFTGVDHPRTGAS